MYKSISSCFLSQPVLQQESFMFFVKKEAQYNKLARY